MCKFTVRQESIHQSENRRQDSRATAMQKNIHVIIQIACLFVLVIYGTFIMMSTPTDTMRNTGRISRAAKYATPRRTRFINFFISLKSGNLFSYKLGRGTFAL